LIGFPAASYSSDAEIGCLSSGCLIRFFFFPNEVLSLIMKSYFDVEGTNAYSYIIG
jgi:hypothetical protein